MEDVIEIVNHYRDLLRLEEQAQISKYERGNISELKREGLALDQFKILRKRFGFGDYPVLKIAYSKHNSVVHFKEGTPLQFKDLETEEQINGRVLYMNNGEGEIALFCDDFEEWMERKTCVFKVLPDNKSFSQMHAVLKIAENDEKSAVSCVLKRLYGIQESTFNSNCENLETANSSLNSSQKDAVQCLLQSPSIHVVHGPPGTGKTTTLTEAVMQWVQMDQTILITAPANAAVDHFASQLLKWKVPFVRLGNVHKARTDIWDYTPEGLLSQPDHAKALKKLKIQAEEYRKMANQYKRSFGKEEREQRNLLRKHYRELKKEIGKETDYILEKELKKVNVILGTPVALQSDLIKDKDFDVVIIDEAGQCLLPMALLAMKKAKSVVLSGDPFQLPPTVISEEAANKGLNLSVLEIAFAHHVKSSFLDTQYRMPPQIADFSSQYFYEGKLKSSKENQLDNALTYIDTAGANFSENVDGTNSKYNQKELNFILHQLPNWVGQEDDVVFISPYSAQIALAKEVLPDYVRCATIDSFQGQEAKVVIISLVRSNEAGQIGFLKEYRRMNVAMTRAQESLYIIGDSATIGNDEFYGKLLTYVENENAYKSVFEFADVI